MKKLCLGILVFFLFASLVYANDIYLFEGDKTVFVSKNYNNVERYFFSVGVFNLSNVTTFDDISCDLYLYVNQVDGLSNGTIGLEAIYNESIGEAQNTDVTIWGQPKYDLTWQTHSLTTSRYANVNISTLIENAGKYYNYSVVITWFHSLYNLSSFPDTPLDAQGNIEIGDAGAVKNRIRYDDETGNAPYLNCSIATPVAPVGTPSVPPQIVQLSNVSTTHHFINMTWNYSSNTGSETKVNITTNTSGVEAKYGSSIDYPQIYVNISGLSGNTAINIRGYSFNGTGTNTSLNSSNSITIVTPSAPAPIDYFPSWRDNGDNSTGSTPNASDVIQLYLNVSDDNSLSYIFFMWNDTGSWTNFSNYEIDTESIIATANSSITPRNNETVAWRVMFNDSINQWNISDTFTFIAKNMSSVPEVLTVTLTSPANESTETSSPVNLAYTVSKDSTCSVVINSLLNQSGSVSAGANSFSAPFSNSTGNTWSVNCSTLTLTGLSEEWEFDVAIPPSTPTIPHENALGVGICPNTLPLTMILGILTIIALFLLVYSENITSGMILFGVSVMIITLSFVIAGCQSLFGLAFGLIGLILMIRAGMMASKSIG